MATSVSTFFFFGLLLCSARAEMTLPRQLKLLLIADPSLSRAPVASVLAARSDPARSTKLISELLVVSLNFLAVPVTWFASYLASLVLVDLIKVDGHNCVRSTTGRIHLRRRNSTVRSA